MSYEDKEGHEHVSTTEARAASPSRMTRTILIVSLIAVIAIFAILLLGLGGR